MSMILQWRHLDYLAKPSHNQTEPYGQSLLDALNKTQLVKTLKVYLPTVVGEAALGINLPGERVRLLCEVYSTDAFSELCRGSFDNHPRFSEVDKQLFDHPSHVVRFRADGFRFEIIGCPHPVEDHPLFLLTAIGDRMLRVQDDPETARRGLKQARVDAAGEEGRCKTPLAELYCDHFKISRVEGQSAVDAALGMLDLDDAVLAERMSTAVTEVEAVQTTSSAVASTS